MVLTNSVSVKYTPSGVLSLQKYKVSTIIHFLHTFKFSFHQLAVTMNDYSIL